MTKTERIEKHILNLFGELGHGKGQFQYERWLNHHAVVEIVNDFGGCRDILSETTPTKLIEKLEAIAEVKRYLK